MDTFAVMQSLGHEQLVLGNDPSCGYVGIIAIHDTTLGPALGGTRFWKYASTDEAVTDALRLARGMTYKSAVAGLNLGGGKSVIIGDNKRPDREALFRAHGRFIETLNGRYITAEDVGTSPADMEYVRLETNHVAGLMGMSGDPSPITAYGVYMGMKATAHARWNSDSLAGKTIAVQGCGKVAYYLSRHLHAEGAKLIVTDIDAETGRAVFAHGLLYAPDYVINGGGVINVYGELHHWPEERSKKKAGEIYDTLTRIFEIARRDGIPTFQAADRLAEQRIAAVNGLDKMWMGSRP